jgi:hypothetical protein
MHYRIFSTIIFGIVFAGTAHAQNTTKSPYTLFGLGELQPSVFFNQASMGSISRGLREENQFSINNPASYSALKFAKFEYGSSLELVSQKTETEENQYSTGKFNYLILGMPLSEKHNRGLAFGMLPYSNVGYNTLYVTQEDSHDVIYTFEGTGGINKVFAGYGMDVYKGLSMGFNAGYLFGNIKQSKDKRYDLSKDIYSLRDVNDVRYSGYTLDFGVQYYGQTKKEVDYVLGLTYKPSSVLKSSSNRVLRTYNASGNFFIDSILSSEEDNLDLNIPSQLGFGFSIGKKGSWMIGGEYESADWSSFKSVDQLSNLKEFTKYSVGGYLQFADETDKQVLKGDRFSHFLKSIRYYWGVNFQEGYLNVNDVSIDQLGISFGLGLPVMREKVLAEGRIPVVSRITIGAEYISRGTTSNDLIQEDYLKIKLGLSLSDKWFQQKKFR